MVSILSPMTGTAIPLEQVPDRAFSHRLLGDGIAILPKEGVLVSPVDGILSAIIQTLHAYVFQTEDGLEILVHVGLESVGLQGRGFYPLVEAGNRVRAGEPVADIDLTLLQKKGVPLYTPVVLIEGGDGRTLKAVTGSVEAGRTTIFTID